MLCVDCQDRLLDHAYGLLDPAEVADVESHVADCPACATAAAGVRTDRSLLSRAAKLSFPHVEFVAPVPGRVISSRPKPRAVIVRWVLAAGILLAVSGIVGPTLYSSVRTAAHRNESRAVLASVRSSRENWLKEKAALDGRTITVRNALESATRTHDTVLTEWIAAETEARNAPSFAVDVTGPASAVAGAPNDYRIRVSEPLGKPVAAGIDVTVTDAAGKVRAASSYDAAAGKTGVTFRLPASVWNDLPAGSGLTLAVTATDATGQKSRVAEPIDLLPPLYTTLLVTDRPLYQPGETVFFRSVTLDRTRFLPPDRDLPLRFVLLDPNANPVPGLTVTGLSAPVTLDPAGRPLAVPGPDRQPVRGVGCGGFALSPNLPDGEYALAVYELPAGWSKVDLPSGTKPLAKRKVSVRKYTTPALATTLEFEAPSYASGEVVTAKYSAVAQGRPLAGVQILTAASADGKRLTTQAPFTLDEQGRATVRFTLPAEGTISAADVKITLLHGDPQVLTRPVPLARQKSTVEFFPEGGDLVAGVEGRVYFRARSADGKPIPFRGRVFDGDREVCPAEAPFDAKQPETNRGIGTFSFVPEAGKQYVLRDERGEYPLPDVKAGGIGLQIPAGVTGSADPISVRLTSGGNRKHVVVGAYTRGRPVATVRTTLEPGRPTTVELRPEPGSPGGATRVTVFEEGDDDGPGRKVLKPVAERLMFRRPAEALVLDYSVPAGAASPGSPVSLTVSSKTETGRPTGAVLWAAVVSETVFGRTDDRTARGLPAHFYICGEVEKPDDLEFADFLLTDHPKAAESLDRLLATQGWRRFAEQAPDQFHRTAPPDDADRLLVAVGSRGAVPAEYRPLVRRVADRFEPLYRKAQDALNEAERNVKADSAAFDSSQASYSYALSALSRLETNRRTGDGWYSVRWVFVCGLVLVAGGLLLARSLYFRRGEGERKPMAVAAGVAVALAGYLALTSAFDTPVTDDEVEIESRLAHSYGISLSVPKPLYAGPPRVGPAPTPAGAVPSPMAVPLIEKPLAVPGVVRPDRVSIQAALGSGTPLESAATGRPVVRAQSPTDPRTSQFVRDHMARTRTRLTAVPPGNPTGDTVRAAASAPPPFLVREYAHARPESRSLVGSPFDASDTVYWHPVLVVPESGSAEVRFSLSDGTSGYRVLFAGHTLDGRVGSVTGTLIPNAPR